MKATKLVEHISAKFIAWTMILIMAFLTVVSILYRSYIDVTYQEMIHYRTDNVVLAFVFLVAVIVLVCFLQKKQMLEKIPEIPLLIFVLVFVAGASGIWAYASDCVPVADQRWILKCVEGLMNGDYFCMNPKSPDGYLQYNRHQVGLTSFY